MLNKYLLFFIFYFHTFIWIYLIFGSFISVVHARIILYWIIPFIYLIHILNFHILVQLEKNLIDHRISDDELKNNYLRMYIPLINPFLDLQTFLEENCFLSPLSTQGMLILSAIISSNVIRFNFNLFR